MDLNSEEDDDVNLLPHSVCPWLVYYNSKTHKQTICCNISGPPPVKSYRLSIHGLRGKEVVSCSFGWLVLYHVNTKILSLCNSTTFGDTIILPKLHQLSEYKIDSCTLLPNQNNNSSSSSGNFKVLIFLEKYQSVMCCRVAVDEHDHDTKWHEIGYWKQLKTLLPNWIKKAARDYGSPLFLSRPVACGGKIYARLCAEWLCCYYDIWCIEMVEEPIGLVVLPELNANLFHLPSCPGLDVYLLESCGELFLLYFSSGNIMIYKMKFDTRVWEMVTNLGDRAFFIGRRYCLSCPITGYGRIYFSKDGGLYCYCTHDESIVMHMPIPPFAFPIWIMPPLRDENINNNQGRNSGSTRSMLELDEHSEEKGSQRKLSAMIKVSHENINNNQGRILELDEQREEKGSERKLSDLPNDVIIKVLNHLLPKENLLHLFPFDYMNFRAVSRSFGSLFPPISWREFLFESDLNFPLPFLMFADRDQSLFNFVDPRGINNSNYYLMTIPHDLGHLGVIRCSNQGCFIFCERDSANVHLYNPFSGDLVNCDTYFHGHERNQSLFFLSDDPSGSLVSVGFFGTKVDIVIVIRGHEERTLLWELELESNMVFEVERNTNPVLFEDSFYYLDQKGDLGKLEIDLPGLLLNWEILGKPVRPHSCFLDNFLVECGGKLISVYVGRVGECLAVYKLSDCKHVWETVTTLGDYNLYLNPVSSLSSCCEGLGERNRIYFPLVRGGSKSEIVFFSLETGKWHFSGSQDLCADLYGTRLFLNSCWIKPSFREQPT